MKISGRPESDFSSFLDFANTKNDRKGE